MVADTSWRELARFEDLLLARAVATSIAAMEFEVRLCGSGLPARTDDAAHPGRPPYIVQVVGPDREALAEVLDEIIQEQQDFDRWVLDRRAAGRHGRLAAVIAMTGAAEFLLLLAMMDW